MDMDLVAKQAAEIKFLAQQNAAQFEYLTRICNRLTGEDCRYPDLMALSHNIDRALDELLGKTSEQD